MKFLPLLRPVAVLSLLVACDACSTPANRRELYNTSLADSGPWHDYARRREAEAQTGVSGGSVPSVLPGRASRPTAAPPSSALPPGSTVITPAPAPAAVPPAPVVAPDAPPGAAPIAPPVPPAPAVDPTISTTPVPPP